MLNENSNFMIHYQKFIDAVSTHDVDNMINEVAEMNTCSACSYDLRTIREVCENILVAMLERDN